MSLPVPSEQTHLAHPKYRADIDGLRAIAVLSVVGYHAFPGWLKGGFVGVDIFFIISGFLISSIVLNSLSKDTFSFTEFYARRVKRIFPALMLVISACFVFGWLVLLPDEFKQLGKHITAGAGFVSNFFFWEEAGYFDTSAESKPLLHLWSLGIEEQFYIVWPLLLYFAFKKRINFLALTLIFIALSFSMNVAISHSDPVQNFYSPLTRFWELMLGSILAYLTLQNTSPWEKAKQLFVGVSDKDIKSLPANSFACNIQSASGMLLILFSVFMITKDRTYPGWWALLPTTGAYLVISAGQHAWLNRTLLSHRVMVWFGLISYPLYLWHWPLLSFTRILESGTPAKEARIAALLISIVLAWLTYRLIEKPVRLSSRSSRNVVALCILMIVIGCIGFNVYKQDGLIYRANVKGLTKKIGDLTWETSKFNYMNCPLELKSPPNALGYCLLSGSGNAAFAIFGDSHADHIFHGIASLDRKNTWLFVGNNSCPPLSGVSAVNPLVKNCRQISEKALQYINKTPSIKTVVLSFFGNYMLDTPYAKDHLIKKMGPQSIELTSDKFPTTDKVELFYFGLEKVVTELELHDKLVIVIVDIPELPFLPRDCLRPAMFGVSSTCKLTTAAALDRQKELRGLLLKLADKHPGLRVYDPLHLFCDKDNCKFETDNLSLYRDSHHLSLRGSSVFAHDFLNWLYHPS